MQQRPLEAAFGSVLRRLRTDAGLSQEALAEAAHLHPNYVYRLEQAGSSPTLATISALADALVLRPSELVRLAEDEAQSRGHGNT